MNMDNNSENVGEATSSTTTTPSKHQQAQSQLQPQTQPQTHTQPRQDPTAALSPSRPTLTTTATSSFSKQQQSRREKSIESTNAHSDEEEEEEEDEDDDDAGDYEKADYSHPLDRSEELNDDELRELLEQASALTGLNNDGGFSRPTSAHLSTRSHAQPMTPALDELYGDDGDEHGEEEEEEDGVSDPDGDGDGDGDGDVASLHRRLNGERAMLSALMQQLNKLHTQATHIQHMKQIISEVAATAQREEQESKERKEKDGVDEHNGSVAEKPTSRSIGSGRRSNEQSDSSESDDDDICQSAYVRADPVAVTSTSSPTDSDIDMDALIERNQYQNRSPTASDADLYEDARQLRDIEVLMAELEAESMRQKAARQAGMTEEERELDDDEAEVDQRLFFSQQMREDAAEMARQDRARYQRTANAYGYARPSALRYGLDADEHKHHHASASSPSSSPSHSRSIRSNPHRASDSVDSSGSGSPHHIARLPVSSVPPVPEHYWIGPSRLPPTSETGGSGHHPAYEDRPATAVGTARAAMARPRHTQTRTHPIANGTTTNRSRPARTNTVQWQVPTLSALPHARRSRAGPGSVSSKNSMFVNADSEVSTPPSESASGFTTSRTRAGSSSSSAVSSRNLHALDGYDIMEDDAEYEDDDAVYAAEYDAEPSSPLPNGIHASHSLDSSPSPSDSNSDSDSDLAYTINARWTHAYASRDEVGVWQSTPASHRIRTAWPATAAAAAAASASSSSSADSSSEYDEHDGRSRGRGRGRAYAYSHSFVPSSPLFPSDRQHILAHIGMTLFTATLDIGNTSAGQTQLGAGRLRLRPTRGHIHHGTEQQQVDALDTNTNTNTETKTETETDIGANGQSHARQSHSHSQSQSQRRASKRTQKAASSTSTSFPSHLPHYDHEHDRRDTASSNRYARRAWQ